MSGFAILIVAVVIACLLILGYLWGEGTDEV